MKNQSEWIWQNGEIKPWDAAVVHGMAHGLHYGSTVFEGMRSYQTSKGAAIFRLHEHVERLFDSCRLYYTDVPYTQAEIRSACCEIVRRNELSNCYIRPLVYRDVSSLGLAPAPTDPVGVLIGAFEWAPLLGEESATVGASVCVSSWTRICSATNPVMAKAGGHYLSSQLIAMEAKRNGYDEGIAVSERGIVTEGAGSNLFMIYNGKIHTPSLGLSILEGITRNSLIQIAEEEGAEVVETGIPREALYKADEIFLCGTAAEIAPVVSVDRIDIGDGKPGAITVKLQQRFRQVVTGCDESKSHWLSLCAS